MNHLGDYDTTETVRIPFNTFTSDDPSASVTITNLAASDVEIHKDGSTTQRASDNGVSVSIDFDGVTGGHIVSIDLSDNSDAGYYAAGSRYQVRMEGTTIDGGTVNAWVGTFSIGCVLRPTTAGRKLDILTTGEAAANVTYWGGTQLPSQTTAGYPDVNCHRLADNEQSATDLRDFADAGYDPGTNKVQGVVLTDTCTTNTDLVTAAAVKTAIEAGGSSLAQILADTNELQTDDVPGLISTHDGKLDTVDGIVDNILVDTAEIGAAGAGLTSLPWNASWDAEVQSECNDALVAQKLDHLVAVADSDDPADNSIVAKLAASDGDWSGFSAASDSLEAIRDRGDAAWTTGGGGSITDILNVQPLIPVPIDIADTATWRLGLMLYNAVDDLPSTAEITPGTVSIDRKAVGATSWSAVVTDAACSEAAGLIYYDEVFDSGTGYVAGDAIRITFKSQKITVAANDYEITDATGRMFYSSIGPNQENL